MNLVAGAVIALLLLRGLDALALGDDSAVALGVRPGWVRVWSLVSSVPPRLALPRNR